MEATELLGTRASNGKLAEPAPDDATLDAIVQDALRAPDHAALRPWRIFKVRGEARERLGELFAEVEGGEGAALERARRKPLRAPLLLVVAAVVKESPKAPEIEQVLSAGAVAHGILLGLQARGYAGIWRTGLPAYAPRMKKALGLSEADHIVGFIYAGTPTTEAPNIKRPSPADHLFEWKGEPG